MIEMLLTNRGIDFCCTDLGVTDGVFYINDNFAQEKANLKRKRVRCNEFEHTHI